MIIDKIKGYVRENVGVRHCFLFKGSRNQNDRFYGMIYKVFPAVFLIKLDNGNVKCFSYSDFLISNISIVD